MENVGGLRGERLVTERRRKEGIVHVVILVLWFLGMYWSHGHAVDEVDYRVCASTVTILGLGAVSLVRMYCANYDYLDPWMKPDETEHREMDSVDSISVLSPLADLNQDYAHLSSSTSSRFRSPHQPSSQWSAS